MDLTTKIIKNNNGYETRILKGVEDLTEYVLGAELVIDDDGLDKVKKKIQN